MKSVYALLVLFCTLILSVVTMAQEAMKPTTGEVESVDQALGLLGNIISAVKNGQYLMAGALSTLVLVFVFRKFVLPKIKLGPGVLPLVSVVLGILVGSAVAIKGGADASQAMLAVLSGPMASSLWDVLAKYFFKKPELK